MYYISSCVILVVAKCFGKFYWTCILMAYFCLITDTNIIINMQLANQRIHLKAPITNISIDPSCVCPIV